MVFESIFSNAKEKSHGCQITTYSRESAGTTPSDTKNKTKHSRSKKKKSTQSDFIRAKERVPRTQPIKKNWSKGPSAEAMDLSTKLKAYSMQKRLRETLELYHDKDNDHIRDGHHACIVVDCCARCGNIQKGQEIVEDLKRAGVHINVYTQTALLKGYSHSGMMEKAVALYLEMSRNKNRRDKPNVRTLNTILRGCMWAAASTKLKGMNHLTSELIWSTSVDNQRQITPDGSSFEYSISILSQALRCEDACKRLKRFMDAFSVESTAIKDNGRQCYSASDPSILETLGVSFFNISRAYALLGNKTKAIEYSKNALDVIASARSSQQSIGSDQKSQAGGKRAWKSGGKGQNDQQGYSRRDESNTLFRAHKLNELEIDAKMIVASCTAKDENVKVAKQSLARRIMLQIMYFSGGGTTDLSASTSHHDGIHVNVDKDRKRLIDSLWFCFGLCSAMKKEFPQQTFEAKNRKGNNTEIDYSRILDALKMTSSYILHDDGTVDFDAIFAPTRKLTTPKTSIVKRPLNIELGSGFGEWAVFQALSNPGSDIVAVELRSDRVGQMFSKAFLNENIVPIQNICCVGAECGSFLRKVKGASVSKIFVNHPEPPTQTFGANTAILKSISEGGEEPAHMLNSELLKSAAQCLDKETGQLIIVTDNRFYGNLICATMIKVMNENEGIFFSAGLKQSDGMYQLEVFKGNNKNEHVVLYEGQPNRSIHHFAASDNSNKGSTYFDRLWRKGAGNHAETHKRFIICMCRSKPNESKRKAYKSSASIGTHVAHKGGKKKRKRSSIQQQKRNERRLKRKSEGSDTNI